MVASVSSGARERIFEQILGRLSSEICTAIDEILEVPEGDRRSTLFRLKEYPPEATAATITTYIDRYELLRQFGVERIDLTGVATAQVLHLAKLAGRYDARALKRFAPAKCCAMVACFLVETQKSLLDHIVAMHDQFVTSMARKSRITFEERQRELRKSAKKGLDTLLDAVEILASVHTPDRSEGAGW
jgi:hypothetical protein